MKSVAQKILISLGFITLIALSVIPVSVNAVTSLQLCLTMANSAENPEGKTVEGCRAEEAARVTGGVVDPQANQKTKSLIPQLFDFAGGIMGTVFFPVFQTIMTMTAGLLGFSGLFLDYIIDLTVVKLAGNLENITAINNTWKVIRDLANMSFIFILLYQGIRMVLGLSDGKNSVQNVVKNIIVAAILVNFSLFFTKVIIDASNIVTLGFYRSIVSSGTGEVIPGYETNFGLAGAFMKALRLSSLYKVNFFETWASTALSGAQGPLVFAGNTVFMLIATFVFLAVAIMFIIRYLSFIILLIMSPIAFVAMAIPGLNDLKEKYVKTLTSQALFAPVFMLLTWVMLTLAGDSGFLKSTVGGTLGDALTRPDGSTISLIVEYTLIIGLLIQTLVLSKSVATKGGMVTSKYIDKGTAFLGGTMFGGAAALGRNTIGAKANEWAGDKDLRAKAASGDKFAQLKLKTYSGVASSSFDARKGMIGENAQKQLGVDFGKGALFNAKNTGEKGYAGKIEQKAKAEAEYVKKLKPSKEEEDAAKAEANENMKSSYFLNEEKDRKNEFFNNAYRAQVAKDRKPLEDALAPAKAEYDRVKNELDTANTEYSTSKTEIDELNKTLERLKDAVFEGAAEERKVAQEALKAQTEILNKAKVNVDEKTKTFTGVQKIFTEAQNTLAEFNKNEQKTRDNWESKEWQELVALAGGRKKDPSGKADIDAKSEYQRRADVYASKYEDKAEKSEPEFLSSISPDKIWSRVWNGNTSLNKAIAKKIRAEAKSKSDEQQLTELLKKQAEDARKKEANDAKENTPTEPKEAEKPTTT